MTCETAKASNLGEAREDSPAFGWSTLIRYAIVIEKSSVTIAVIHSVKRYGKDFELLKLSRVFQVEKSPWPVWMHCRSAIMIKSRDGIGGANLLR
jgi:hypothetical protein